MCVVFVPTSSSSRRRPSSLAKKSRTQPTSRCTSRFASESTRPCSKPTRSARTEWELPSIRRWPRGAWLIPTMSMPTWAMVRRPTGRLCRGFCSFSPSLIQAIRMCREWMKSADPFTIHSPMIRTLTGEVICTACLKCCISII